MRRLLFIVFLFSIQSFAQLVYWEPVFSHTKSFSDLDLASNGYIFASALGVFRSTDNGENWTYAGPSNGGVYKLTIDENDVLYAGKSGQWPGIYISTDYGDTWIVSNQEYVAARSMHTSPEGYIYIGEDDGDFIKSTNSGNTWSVVNICDQEISSIVTLPDGQIFVSTLGRSLFTSTDYGETWTQIVDSNLLNSISSVIADSNGYLYAEHSEKISKSTDAGQTWSLTGFISSYPSSPIFGLDENNNLYYAYHRVYKSTDEGITWNNLGGPSYIRSILLDSDRIFIGTSNLIYRYDPSVQIYVGNNYLPLSVGNKWQYLGHSCGYPQGVYSCGYWLTQIEVTEDTLINNIKYFKYLYDWVRYSEEDKKIYVWYNNADRVHMDFTLTPEVSFVQFPLPYNNVSIFNTHQNRIATFKHGNTTMFNTSLNYKGFGFDSSYAAPVEYEECRYSENFGPSYFNYGGGYVLKENNIIMAVLYDSQGNPINYTNNYKPQITLIPLTIVNFQNFNMTFLVEHPYSKITWHFNFVDSVYLESFYQKNDSIVYNENIIAFRVPNSANYQVSALLDTNLLIDKFDFKYRIVAKDKGIIPGITSAPDSGYYKCTWDFGTEVNDKKEIIKEFSLSQNYPNPFNPVTSIEYRVGSIEYVTLKVFDVLGREVATLVNEEKQPGVYEVEFNPESGIGNLASGVYYYQLKAGNFVETKKMILLR